MRAFNVLLILGLSAALLPGTPIPGLISSGTAAPGSMDPGWLVAYSPTPGASSLSFQPTYTTQGGYPFPYWLANDSNSSWISPHPSYGGGSGPYADPVGYHYFLLSFNLGPGYDPTTATFSFRLSTDNWLNSIWLNSTYIPSSNYGNNGLNHTFWSAPITIGPGPSSGFVPGVNHLVVVVYNLPVVGGTDPDNMATWNPAGLRFDLLSSNIVYTAATATAARHSGASDIPAVRSGPDLAGLPPGAGPMRLRN